MKLAIKFFLFVLISSFSSSSIASRVYFPMDSVIKWSPLILEGKVVEVTPSYMLNRTIYTSYIVRVLKLFKGQISREYFEIRMMGGTVGDLSMEVQSCGTLHIPGKGVTAIFFLTKPRPFDSLNHVSVSGDTLARNYVIEPYYDALDVGPGIKNIERDLYRHIELVTGIKRKILRSENIPMLDKRNWLTTKTKKYDGKETIACLDFVHSGMAYGQKSWDLFIDLNAYPHYTDLKSLKFGLRYNEKAFGTYVVKNKNVAFNNTKLYRLWNGELNANLLNGAYETKIEDLDSSSILISIELKDSSLGIFQIAKAVVAFLEFRMKSQADSNINFTFLPAQCKGKYFNYEKRKISKFDDILCAKDSYTKSTINLTPVIYSFSPDTVNCNHDVLTIKGRNFSTWGIRVEFESQSGSFCPMYQIQFVSNDDSTIVLKVPCGIGMNGRTCGSIKKGETYFKVSINSQKFSGLSPKPLFVE